MLEYGHQLIGKEVITDNKSKLILGDCYEEIKKLKDKSIDLVIIDPPYKINKGSGKVKNNRISKSLSNLSNELDSVDLCDGIDLKILDEFIRVMKKPNIYIWCNKAQILDYLNFFVGKYKCSFEILVWIKTNPIPSYGKNYLNDKEFCLYFRQGVPLNTTYQTAKTYWITPTNVKDKKRFGHPTIKPLEIIEIMVRNSSKEGDLILDCFLGSGTTAVAAKGLNREYIGIEKNTRYFDLSVKRVEETTV